LKIEVLIDQCTTQHAQNVGSHAKYRSSQQKADRFTAEIATNQNHDSDSISTDLDKEY
jgi:hypothetical protein